MVPPALCVDIEKLILTFTRRFEGLGTDRIIFKRKIKLEVLNHLKTSYHAAIMETVVSV